MLVDNMELYQQIRPNALTEARKDRLIFEPFWDDFKLRLCWSSNSVQKIIENIAEQHICFERIHPFSDGNGRTGRIMLNQQLINAGLLPITIEKNSKYRQAFKFYDKNKDVSLMAHVISSAEIDAMNRIKELQSKRDISTFGYHN